MNNNKNNLNILSNIKSFFSLLFQDNSKDEFLLNDSNEDNSSINTNIEYTDISNIKKIYPNIDLNLEYMKIKFNSMINSDIAIRDFKININNKIYNAFIIYIDGMVNQNILNNDILKPLMFNDKKVESNIISEVKTNNITIKKIKKFDIGDYIYNFLLPQNNIKKIKEFDLLISDISLGNTVLFIDTLDFAFDIDIKGFEKRSLSNPNNEVIIKGSQVGFTEDIRTNTTLLRKYINNENLIIENFKVGEIGKTSCSVCYLKNIANNDLVSQVKYRINNLKIDYISSSGNLEQLIQDNGFLSLPQIISTERPDRVSNYLLDGRVAIIVNGSPYVLVVPGLFSDFLSSSEDLNIKHQYANFLRILRFFAFLISVLLPGLYIAITNFHQELIPTELLFAIVASRESVPFPILFELLTMELSFELIREASIRVPSPVGPTLGIVGALILGQAAVDASIVSPILIIVVSITAICSFANPDYSLEFHSRISRLIYIVLGAFGGFLGISSGIIVHIGILLSMKSFGVNYIEKNVFTNNKSGKALILSPAWMRENRSSFINSKRPRQQEDISMKWKY